MSPVCLEWPQHGRSPSWPAGALGDRDPPVTSQQSLVLCRKTRARDEDAGSLPGLCLSSAKPIPYDTAVPLGRALSPVPSVSALNPILNLIEVGWLET